MPIDPFSPQARVATLVAAGFNAADAAQWVRDSDAALPPGADPYAWVPDAGTLAMTAVIDEAAVQDARAAWYVDAPLEWKLLLDDLSGQASEVGLGEAVFYNPYHDERGRFTSALAGRASIEPLTGEVVHGGETAPQLGGEIADLAWIEQNVKIDGPASVAVRYTLANSQVPRRYLEGLERITTDTPSGYGLDKTGRYYNKQRLQLDVCGVYRHDTRTIYISPSCVASQATIIHELGHHARSYVNRGKPTQIMDDVLEYRKNAFPRKADLHKLGLREYSLTDGHELYADSFVVALKGSPAQQAEWRRVTGIDVWDAVFAEANLFDPGQARVPAGLPTGGQFAPSGGSATSTVTSPKLSYHAFQRMRERNKYSGVRETMKRLADRPTPAGDWWVAMTRKGQVDGYLVGTDGVVKTVLGAWGQPRGMEVRLAEMAEISRLNVRKSIDWQLANLTPGMVAAFCRLAGIDPLTPAQFHTNWLEDWQDWTADGLEALLIARSEAEDVAPEEQPDA
jgi:hypothetical protein